MVTRAAHRPARAGTLATALRAVALLAALVAAGAFPPRPARAQEATLYFLTVKQGEQQVGGSLFGTLAANHGARQENLTVIRSGAELDIYGVTRHKYGLAAGLEVMDYNKTFTFQDPTGVQTPERLRLNARSVLFTLKAFLRFGDFLPFIGLGTGTYYVSYNEQVSGLSFVDTATSVFAYRAGFRWIMAGRLGLLVEGGEIFAPIRVLSNSTTSTLELGGSFFNAGLSYVW